MSHLWIPDRRGAWGALPLAAHAYSLTALPPRAVADGPDSEPPAARVRLVPVGDGTLALIAGARRDVALNGMPLTLGFAVITDRDEIAVGGVGRVYWSAEQAAEVVPFPGGDVAFTCPRCATAIAAHQLAVQCPGCGIWHHEDSDRRCFTYTETCTMCPHPTTLDGGLRWVPEGL